MSDGVPTGVLLMAIAAGVPFVILAGGCGKGGSHELAIGLAIVLPAISTLLVPFAADLIVPGSERVNVPPTQLIGLVAYQFVPLLLGLLAAIALPSISAKLLRITKPITLVALLALLATLVPLIIKSAGAVFGSFGILAIVSIVVVSLAAGGRGPQARIPCDPRGRNGVAQSGSCDGDRYDGLRCAAARSSRRRYILSRPGTCGIGFRRDGSEAPHRISEARFYRNE